MDVLKIRDFVNTRESYHFARGKLTFEHAPALHTHDFHEIFWIESGRALHCINEEEHEVNKQKCVLVQDKDQHRVHGATEKISEIANLAFPTEEWEMVRQNYFPDEEDVFTWPHALREISWPFLSHPLSGWAFFLDVDGHPRRRLHAFLIQVAEAALLSRIHLGLRLAPEWLMNAVEKLRDEKVLQGGTQAFCRVAGRSPEHVIRECRRWLKCTPTEILNQRRMEYAARSLAVSAKPIADICYDCGLENISHFYRLFQARFNISPRKYRLRAMGPLPSKRRY